MTLTQLEVFVAVAELRSFTAAAGRLRTTQSAVSHAIRALEADLGVSLLDRQAPAVVPTDIGRELLARAREMLGLSETMRQQAAAARGLRQGSLRIGSFGPSASLRLLPPILDAFRARYPGIGLHLDEGTDDDVLDWLQERRVDLGVVVLPESRFDTLALARDQLVAVMPASHPLARKRSVALQDLCDQPFILTEAGSSRLVTRLFAAANLHPDVRFRSAQLLTTLGMVARGDGLSVVAELAIPAGFGIDGSGLAWRPLRPRAPRTVGLAVPDERIASPAAQAFLRIARELSPALGKP